MTYNRKSFTKHFSSSGGMSFYTLLYSFIKYSLDIYVNVYFCNFKVFSAIRSLVNFTSLQFCQCFLYKLFAVFHNCQKQLDDKTHLHRNSFRLNLFSHAVTSEIVMKIDQL